LFGEAKLGPKTVLRNNDLRIVANPSQIPRARLSLHRPEASFGAPFTRSANYMRNRARSLSWILLAVVPLSRAASQARVTLDHESKHHQVFVNQWTRVLDVVVPGGDSTLYHVHPNDYVFVTFGAVTLKSQALGAAKADLVLADGEVRMTAAPITHRVLNVSTNPFHNLTIELLKSSGVALSPTVAGTTVLDNARVRVERIVLEPGASTIRHEHTGPGLDVSVSAGTVDIINAKGSTQHLTLAPAWYRWNDASRVHTIKNVGKTRVEIVEIDWK
jgi:quercetin dioxygenase-like cupin family protein